jgi:calcium/calmodulin-dependent protein kinase (CaM kinase) II
MNPDANDALVHELLELNQQLLESIADGDWDTYAQLCDPALTAFEPETGGHLVEGMAFHRFYFDLGGATGPHNVTMSSPKVLFLGADAAVLSYVRLVQRLGETHAPVTAVSEETRVWQRRDGAWRHVHFHRSIPK